MISPLMEKRYSGMFRALSMIVAVLMLTGMMSRPAAADNTQTVVDSQAQVQAVAAERKTEVNSQSWQMVTVNNCGQVTRVATQGETVAQLLQRLNIPYEGDYKLDTPADTATYDGMAVAVDWVVTATESYCVEVPFETVYQEDPTLAAGEEKILTEGKAGQAVCTAQVVYENTVEISREVQSQQITQEPVDQVIAVGTGEDAGNGLVIGENYIQLPTGEVLTYTHKDTYEATAYTSWIDDMTGTTATGTKARVGAVAVDPNMIPYGTRMFIVTSSGDMIYGIATAEDCGGAINGKRIDLFFDTEAECWQFGRRNITVYFLGDADWRGPQNNG